MIYQFYIAGLRFQLNISWPITLSANFLPFMEKPSEHWDEHITLTCLEEFPAVPQPTEWIGGAGETLLDGKKCVLHRLSEISEPYLMELYHSGHDRTFAYLKRSNELPLSMAKVFNNISMEELFRRHDIFILHSAFIRWQGRAILFSAHSGVGKSTQADLWARYQNAEILNGDRSALRRVDGVWTAFGLPFAGSSDIFRSESAPVACIVMLAQGPENVISTLNPAQAFRRVLQEVTLHYWDPAFMTWGMDRVEALLGDVPVFGLSCLPDRGAVDLLHETITREVLS